MRTDGYVAMDDVMQYARSHARRGDRGGRGPRGGRGAGGGETGVHINEALITSIVEDCPKKRFQMAKMEGVTYVRATQGHSIAAVEDDELLVPIEDASEVPMAVHGTTRAAWDVIRDAGLNRMRRNHIHLAVDVPGSDKVVSGARASSKVLIFVDVAKAMADGVVFYKSRNNVILTRGLDGVLAPKYFHHVDIM
jgi:2'-phosphotransferase